MTNDNDSDARAGLRAMDLMRSHGVAPGPENYTIWFHYALGANQDLVREIDAAIANKLPFSKHTTSYLHSKHIAADRDQRTIDDAAVNAQKVLQEVLKIIVDFSSETQSYHKDVDQYMETISQKFEGAGIRDIVRELISATATLKKSGDKIGKKLEESRQEITHLRKSIQQITIEGQRDFLTGAYNRKTFEKIFEQQAETARRNHTDLCLLMVDIDHFKQFNDRFGHLLGDEVLKTVARTLIEMLKGRDVVA
ncbi:MAG: GGDEF domain-containing protein, partial [Pseudomonadota bacterium]|nr:GGDEF domain-containing protein [Pseudomonadota bacterium]